MTRQLAFAPHGSNSHGFGGLGTTVEGVVSTTGGSGERVVPLMGGFGSMILGIVTSGMGGTMDVDAGGGAGGRGSDGSRIKMHLIKGLPEYPGTQLQIGL